jgi:hypothetical protein
MRGVQSRLPSPGSKDPPVDKLTRRLGWPKDHRLLEGTGVTGLGFLTRNLVLIYMYCQRCGSVLGQNARFCQSCGDPQPPVPTPVVPAPDAAQAVTRTQKPKSKIFWIVMGGILLVVIVSILGKSPSDNNESGREKTESSATTESGPTTQEVQFTALKPSEHLSQAKTALKPGATPDQIEEGLRHLRAIPESAPEAAQAKSLTTKLTRAQHLTEAQLLIDSASVDDLKSNMDSLTKANDEIQAVLKQNPHDKRRTKVVERLLRTRV